MVEIMIMAVIVGVVASMAVPRFQRAYQRLQFRSANRDIVSTLRLARSMSISDKQQYGVYFDDVGRTITLFKDVVNPTGNAFETGDIVIRVDTLDQNIEYLSTDITNNTVTFSPNGSAGFTGGGNVITLGMTTGDYHENYHNILRSTGRVRTYNSWDAWALQHASG